MRERQTKLEELSTKQLESVTGGSMLEEMTQMLQVLTYMLKRGSEVRATVAHNVRA